MNLKINDEYVIPNGAGELVVKIIKLGMNTEFLINGDGVQNPESPRKMSTLAFARWIKTLKARKRPPNKRMQATPQASLCTE